MQGLMRSGTPLIVSAPSGGGKTTLCRRLVAEVPDVTAYGAVIVEDQLGNPRPVDGDGVGGATWDRGSIEVEFDWDGLFFDGFEEGSAAAW